MVYQVTDMDKRRQRGSRQDLAQGPRAAMADELTGTEVATLIPFAPTDAAGGRRAALIDRIAFLRAWIGAPLRVAALAPSSEALARLITAGISEEQAPVIELGAGTGVFTRALLARGVPEERIALVESDANLARLLQKRFPRAQVLTLDAARLRAAVLFDGAPAGAVVSGLPLLSMPPQLITAVLAAAFGCLRAGAPFYQFTYGVRCPVPARVMARLGLSATPVGRTLANLPPATVYRITRGEIEGERRKAEGGRK
jgi:phosphatidylethanolamine/phosphatidyl-N-methylethanolamine N-methyltransferase